MSTEKERVEIITSSEVSSPPEFDPANHSVTYWTEAGFGINLIRNPNNTVTAAIVKKVAACSPDSQDVAQLLEWVKDNRPQLTEREREVLRLLCEGKSNKDIARILVISVRTVQVHLANTYQKLGVGKRTEALLVATRLGLLDQPPTPLSSHFRQKGREVNRRQFHIRQLATI